MTANRNVMRLSTTDDVAVAGTKATTLARLHRAGELVPDGFVITVEATQSLDSPTILAEIVEALADIEATEVAVRSSAIDEDLAHDSHAGEYETVLGVTAVASAVIDAARRVTLSTGGSSVAVLVQSMVNARAAGAAFSMNPVTGENEIVVSAVAGLADRLMEGSVTGDEWVVRDGEPIHLSGDAIGSDLVLEIAALADRLQVSFGSPVDIEWAHDGEALHLLQCRPITALPMRPNLKVPEGSWQKDATHHPGPLSPLVASLLGIDDLTIARWCERSGLLIERLEQRSIGGELYIRPVPVGGGSGKAKPPPWWLMGVLARLHPAIRKRMATARRLIASGVLENSAQRWTSEWKPEIKTAVSDLRIVDVASLDDDALAAHIDDVLAFSTRAIEIHFDLFVPYLVALHELVIGCERMLGWEASTTMRLLSGHSLASSEPTRELRSVLAAIRRSPAATAALNGSDGGLVERVSAADPQSGDAIAQWMETYGFRTLQYDWSSPTIAERPNLVGRMIRAEMEEETRFLLHDDAEAKARAQLTSEDVATFDHLLTKAREIYPVREDNIHWTSMVPGALLRRAHLEIGARLANDRLVDTAADVFMLESKEAMRALRERAEPLQDLVRRRRSERAWVAAHPGPGYLGQPPGAPPDLRALPTDGRRINAALMWAINAEFTPIETATNHKAVINGAPGAAGIYTGTARIVRSEADFERVEPGDVVVCAITNPSWAVLFGIAGAFVCDAGGPLSHTAVLTREYDIPSVLATGDATRRIRDGDTVIVDGAAGTVECRG